MKKFTIISYPSAGRTWLTRFFAVYGWVDVTFTHDMLKWDNLSAGKDMNGQDVLRWNELKSVWDPKKYDKHGIILLIRDPRDIVVSYFYQKTVREPWLEEIGRIPWAPEIDMTIDEFALDDVYGFKKIIEFMNLWAQRFDYLISYEDMHRDFRGEMMRLLGFVTKDAIDPVRFDAAVEASTFLQMNLVEGLRDVRRFGVSSPQTKKARKGKVGGYVDELKPETIREIERFMKTSLNAAYWPHYRYQRLRR